MTKYAFVTGNFRKHAKDEISNCYTDGELQKRIWMFGQKYKIITVQPFADNIVMVEYEEST